MSNTGSISLRELLLSVRQALYYAFDSGFWIRAEISEIRENANGHCYLELIEKDASEKLIVAKTKAAIWSDTYRMLKPYFREATGQNLTPGIKILVEVTVNFHEVYGFSCVIRDIDPAFTLGDLAQKRQETIRRLKEDGVWEMNKTLEIPQPANRIAVISSASAAGYGDFINQLQTNKKGYKFQTELFPAIMQGDESAASVIEALDSVYAVADRFDVVVMIRGGGASADMLAFDDYELATHCAQFPLPVITGIGHDRDESIVDMIAHTRCKTPTAAAAFLIEGMAELEASLLRLQTDIFGKTSNYLKEEEKRLKNFSLLFSQQCNLRLQKEKFQLVQIKERIRQKADSYLNKEKNRMDLFAKTLSLLSPQNILKKGYTLTVKDGKTVRSAGELKKGELITTIFADGKKQSIIK